MSYSLRLIDLHFHIISVGMICLLLSACGNSSVIKMSEFNGYAQGTTFHIVYEKKLNPDSIHLAIEKIFSDIDHSMSLYDTSSLISQVNRMRDTSIMVDRHFYNVFIISKKIYQASNGAFNPALYPLIKYWGFGAGDMTMPEKTTSSTIDSLKNLSNFDLFDIIKIGDDYRLIKRNPKLKLDFNGIAQGYTVDVIAEYLESLQILNYMVEVGGEVRAAGHNQQRKPWRIGIDKPVDPDHPRELIAIANLQNQSLATSGNYRKFYVKDGIKFAHTIDPVTGYPVQHSLLSVSFFAPTCAEADGYATACMVLGMDKAKELVARVDNSGIYLIYSDFKGDLQMFMSEGLKQNLQMLKGNNALQ